MKKFFYRITFYTNTTMTEKVMSYIYMKKFKYNVAEGGQIYWSDYFEDLHKCASTDLNKYHNPGKMVFPTRIERVGFFDLIKSFFDKKCKRISPSI